MIERKLLKTLCDSLSKYPVVGILGSRQVGKTTLAKTLGESVQKNIVYLDLELPSDHHKLREPELYLSPLQDSLVIIDEIQRLPGLFSLIRALVDQKRVSGRFLILGSASPDLIKQASESLAGRIIYHELPPFFLNEVGAAQTNRLWLRGGYPNSFLAENEKDSFTWRASFIKTYLEMDLPQLGLHIPSLQLRRFWTMLAHLNAQFWNASTIAKSLGVSAPTAKRYFDILTETFIVRQLQPYHPNIKKRLVKSPRLYIRDTGLLHALLMIRTLDDLQSHPVAGSSWEGFIIEQIMRQLPDGCVPYFYRTSAGAEIDLILFNQKNEPLAIEIKYSLSPKVTKGFWIALQDLSCKNGFVVYPGNESFSIGGGVSALPVDELGRIAEVLS